ncbi:hypothetical protein H8D51_01645 [bacterium]|nr:hypothetical protein [bacterium]
MHKKFLLPSALILMLLGGCIRSFQPLYTEADLRFDPKLVGTWDDEGSKEIWQFTAGDGKFYDLTYTDSDGENALFTIHLLELNGQRFIDFYPAEVEIPANSFYIYHLLGVHTFMHVRQIEPTLQMSSPETDWLEELLQADPTLLQHEVIDGNIYLSASTQKLQAFWAEHLETEGAFSEYCNMARKE